MTYGQPPAGTPGGYQPPGSYQQPGSYPQPPGYPPAGGYAPAPVYAAATTGLGRGSARLLRRIDVLSALKVGAVLSALLWSILGLLWVVVFGICGLSFIGSQNGAGALAGGLIGSIVVYVVGIVLYGIGGGLVAALYAWLYNVTAGFTGGLRVDVE